MSPGDVDLTYAWKSGRNQWTAEQLIREVRLLAEEAKPKWVKEQLLEAADRAEAKLAAPVPSNEELRRS